MYLCDHYVHVIMFAHAIYYFFESNEWIDAYGMPLYNWSFKAIVQYNCVYLSQKRNTKEKRLVLALCVHYKGVCTSNKL